MNPRIIRVVQFALLACILYFVMLAASACKAKPGPSADTRTVETPTELTPTVPVLSVTPNVATFRATIRPGGSAKLTVNGAEVARIYDVTVDSELVLEMTKVKK